MKNKICRERLGKKLRLITAGIACTAAAILLLCGAAHETAAAPHEMNKAAVTSIGSFASVKANKAHFAKVKKEEPVSPLSEWKDWTDIVQTETCNVGSILLGLRKDGSINIYTQNYYSTDCVPQDFNSLSKEEQEFIQEIASWRLIKKLYVNDGFFGYGNIVLGLHEDGHVSSAVMYNEDLNISKTVHYWRNIEDIFMYENTILGVKKDGTVVSNDPDNFSELNYWKDIKAVCCKKDGTVIGIKKDGTAIITDSQIYDVSSWKGIREIIFDYSYCGIGIYGLAEDGELFVCNMYKDNPDWKPSKKVKKLSVYGTPTGGAEYYISTDGDIMEMNSAEFYSDRTLLKNTYAEDVLIDFNLTDGRMQKTVHVINNHGYIKVYTLESGSNYEFYLVDKKIIEAPDSDLYVSFVTYCPYYQYAKLALTDSGRVVKVIDGK